MMPQILHAELGVTQHYERKRLRGTGVYRENYQLNLIMVKVSNFRKTFRICSTTYLSNVTLTCPAFGRSTLTIPFFHLERYVKLSLFRHILLFPKNIVKP